MKNVSGIVLIVAALATTTACATTSFKSTWKAPDAQPVVLSGQKVVAFVLTKNAASRRAVVRSAALDAIPARAHSHQRLMGSAMCQSLPAPKTPESRCFRCLPFFRRS